MVKNLDYDYDKDLMERDSDFLDNLDDYENSEDAEVSDIEEEVDEEDDSSVTEEEPYDIKHHSLLSHEETVDLIEKAQNGDTDARDKLVERNIRLVRAVARSFPDNSIISKADLIQEGVIGLIKSIDKFDLKKGYKFSTYATWWIRQAMQRTLADNSKSIKVPVYLQEELLRIKKVQKSLEQKLNRAPTIKEISEELRIDCSCYDKIVNHDFFENLMSSVDYQDERKEIESIIMEDLEFNPDAEIVLKSISEFIKKKHRKPTFEEINKAVNLDAKKIKSILEVDSNSNVASLNVPATDDFDTCYGDNIASEENVEMTVNQKIIADGLIKALDEVYGSGKHCREYYIKTHSKEGSKNYDPTGEHFIPWNELMKYRYGIGGYQKETLEQLGQRYNISRERVRQIEKSILGNEYDKNGNKKDIKPDARIFKRKIREYCGFDFSDF